MDTGQPSSSSTNFKAESGLILKNEDLLYIILCKLPARSFASSACVCKTWHKVCNQILARPKISSAFSLRTTSRIAVNEVVDKVLSAPIRPHFAIATVGSGFHLNQTIKWLALSLGSQTPIIVSRAGGIMGRHAVTDQFQEVKFAHVDYDACIHEGSTGIVLTVGFVPGLKVDAIPLLKLKRGPPVPMIDQFVMDIRNYTTSFSKCASPVGIIMFGDEDSDLALVMENLDYAMSMESVIVGDERCQFVYRSGNPLRNFREDVEYGAVALTFASDKDKLKASGLRPARFYSMVFASSDIMDYQTIFDIGKIQFHLALSKGVTAIGPRHRVVSVGANNLDRVTWFTARREGNQQVLDGQQILDHINDQLGNDVEWPELYIGVTKRRKFSIGSEKPGLITSLAFHRVAEGDEQYLYAEGTDIRSGDYFRFYHPDTATALASCDNINTKFRNLKAEYGSKSCLHRKGITDGVGKEVLGGFIFSCCCRGEPFFVRCNVDSYPFIENFPDVPVAGIFCGGEIGRGSSSLMGQESQESPARSIQHVFSTVYLLMSYTPVCREH